MAEPWFDPMQFDRIYGAIAGSVTGAFGAILGTVGGILAPRGIGRTWISGSFYMVAGLGALQLLFGLYALVAGQPWHIWFWPFFVGVITIVVFGPLSFVVRLRYRQAEERRLEAEALRKS